MARAVIQARVPSLTGVARPRCGMPLLSGEGFAPGGAGPNAAVQPLAHQVDAAYLPEPYLTGAEMAIGAQPIIRRWRRYAAR